MTLNTTPDPVLDFWFEELTPKQWFGKSDAIDDTIRQRFLATWHQAFAGETWHWRKTSEGRVAEIIVLDQFSRNLFRGQAQAYAADPMALVLSQEMVMSKQLDLLNEQYRQFALMPWMHSESTHVHTHAVTLFEGKPTLEHELAHKAIIDRFGRYPHRNEAVGRESTLEETEWMKTNSGF